MQAGEAEGVRQAPEAVAGEVPLLQREVAEARSSFPMPWLKQQFGVCETNAEKTNGVSEE